jgi:ABC-type iron transport system FetAB ATPase subunit
VLVVTGLGVKLAGRSVLSGIDLELAEGERLAVLGASGCGKSTLLRALAWLLPDVSGSLTFEGRSPVQWGVRKWRRELCLVQQEPPQLEGSALALVQRVAALREQRSRAAAELQSAARELGDAWGLEPEVWGAPLQNLSGGQRQRVMLAIALATKPSLLLLDEPTSALDEGTKRSVEASLAQWTAVWATHDEGQAARIASRTLELPP